MDTGYYAGVTDVLTPEAVQRKIAYLDQVPRRPLLLLDVPLRENVPAPTESDPAILISIEYAFYVPKARRNPMTYHALTDYIAANYRPDRRFGTNLRVWLPNTVH